MHHGDCDRCITVLLGPGCMGVPLIVNRQQTRVAHSIRYLKFAAAKTEGLPFEPLFERIVRDTGRSHIDRIATERHKTSRSTLDSPGPGGGGSQGLSPRLPPPDRVIVERHLTSGITFVFDSTRRRDPSGPRGGGSQGLSLRMPPPVYVSLHA